MTLNMRKSFVLHSLVLILAVGCDDNLPEEMRHLVDTVGQLDVGCTATHIGAGLILKAEI